MHHFHSTYTNNPLFLVVKFNFILNSHLWVHPNPIPKLQHALLPSKCYKLGSMPQLSSSSTVLFWDLPLGLLKNLGTHHPTCSSHTMLWEWHQIIPSKVYYWCKYTLDILFGQMWSNFVMHKWIWTSILFTSQCKTNLGKNMFNHGTRVWMSNTIESHHSWGGIFCKVIVSMFTNGFQLSTKFTKSIKACTYDVASTNIFRNTCLIPFFALASSWIQLFPKR